jgi:hypothetical protein
MEKQNFHWRVSFTSSGRENGNNGTARWINDILTIQSL